MHVSLNFCTDQPRRNPTVESFYYVNYGSSIILSNNLSNENIKTGVSVVFKTKPESNAKRNYF